MFRVRLFALVVPVAVTVLAGSALAYVCHPLSGGERMLTLNGTVRSVAVHGTGVDFLVVRGGRCYRVAEEPLTLYACHCTDCQRHSGTSFALSMVVRRRTFELGHRVAARAAERWRRSVGR